jgi:hypothetical protein
VSDLRKRYDTYCFEKNIDPLMKLNIIGCPELEMFGSKYNKEMYIPYLSGMSLVKIPGLKDSNYIPGIIRIPSDSKARKGRSSLFSKCKNKCLFFLFSSEGIFTNLAVVILHLIMLIGMPLILVIACIWS